MYSEYDQVDLLYEDCFGTKIKAELIIKLLENKSSMIYQNKMMALYGSWGSGKSTVLKTVQKNTQACEFLLFEAWKYESDEDLSLSLFHMILEKIEDEEKISEDVIKKLKQVAKTIFMFSYNLLMNAEANIAGIQINPGQAGKDTIVEMSQESSYYNKVQEFEKLFKSTIKEYVQSHKKPLAILIDDLDRCEPENVLSLLSNIKHLFTAKEIIYICAIDKKAVENSVNIKYGKNIDYLEYLDKIFNFNISMPSKIDINGIIDDFQQKYEKDLIQDNTKWLIIKFFEHIRMDNPRKIRRVLSKFSLLKDITPDNILISNLGEYSIDSYNIVQWLITIIIFEFYPEYYKDIINYKAKLEKLKNLANNSSKGIYIATNHVVAIEDYFSLLSDKIANTSISNDIIDSFVQCGDGVNWSQELMQMIFLFMPSDINKLIIPEFTKAGDRKNNLRLMIRNAHLSQYDIAFKYMEFFWITFSNTNNIKRFQNEPFKYFEYAEKYF